MGSGRDSPRPIIWTASMVGSTSSKVETEEEGSEEYLVTKIKSMARILDPLRRPYHSWLCGLYSTLYAAPFAFYTVLFEN